MKETHRYKEQVDAKKEKVGKIGDIILKKCNSKEEKGV